MPSLASMRSLDPAGDQFQPLGPPIRETPVAPEPASKPTGTPGIVQLPDGKLATNLPDPTVKPVVKVHDSVCEVPAEREPEVGDWLVVLTGQPRIAEINAMIGGCYQVTSVADSSVCLGLWGFNAPGHGASGHLLTRFAAPAEIAAAQFGGQA